MAKVSRNFVSARMNKSVSEKLIKNGEYIDALNIRVTTNSEGGDGLVENALGNEKMTSLKYTDGTILSDHAVTIGKYADSTSETIYWMVHDPEFPIGDTGKLDLILSFNEVTGVLTYHIISIDDGGGVNTTLNFDSNHRINSINKIDNLLFFTDGFNQPRKIDVTKNYSSPSLNIDGFTEDDILVIKRPPLYAPSIHPIMIDAKNNYMSDRFLCFAYRYRYENGEYSATSPFTNPMFTPGIFNFSYDTLLNNGMKNTTNAVRISYNTGDSLVKGVEILFKDSDSNVIKIIDKINKEEAGIPDNAVWSYDFSNSKIFTILPDYEILRLYDNVPRVSEAQTLMGNRLMYGNYVDGYDLIDSDGNQINLNYSASLVSQDISSELIPVDYTNGVYALFGVPVITDSVLSINLSGFALTIGATISMSIQFEHDSFQGGNITPTTDTGISNLLFTYTLQNNYSSAYELSISNEFISAIGNALNVKSVEESCDGSTMADTMNCMLTDSLDSSAGLLYKYRSGVTVFGEGLQIISSPSSSIIGLQLLGMEFVDDPTGVAITKRAYEYYHIINANVSYISINNPLSLHSNRCYEIGIVYLDDYGRMSLPLVSQDNTVDVPCSASDSKNSIRVEIPAEQIPPYWASKYKFVIKQDKQGYETIYSNIFFRDANSGFVYCLLEGENARKVQEGDALYIKRDTDGATPTCTQTVVLEKASKLENFIEIDGVIVPAGVYMKLNPNNFSVDYNSVKIIDTGEKSASTNIVTAGWTEPFPRLEYLCNIYNPSTSSYEDIVIPAGSKIRIYFKFQRLGSSSGCEKRIYILDETITSTNDYTNFKDWFVGDNVQGILNNGIQEVGAGGCSIDNEYVTTPASDIYDITPEFCTNKWRFYRDLVSNALYLLVTGTQKCTGLFNIEERASTIKGNIQIKAANDLLIFETKPQDTLPDVFFEGSQTFDIIGGYHVGTEQNQSSTQSAIIDTDFANCFSFGNGAESYRVEDSINGRSFGLGNRVMAISSQEYKEAERYSDITYSGIYNNESNVNKLNEFNLGLLNFKKLEQSFGAIKIMDGRQTDVLVLQEDKISYVLAGKNLLSDSAAGGTIASVPEVLGTQMARIENYGISHNPESYVKFGANKFFTDAKRNAVIQLAGNSASSEQLVPISQIGMDSWFKGMFKAMFRTQKLGGFDPAHGDYVLSSNNTPILIDTSCGSCGQHRTISVNQGESIEFCVTLKDGYGNVNINYDLLSDDSVFSITASYNGVLYPSGEVSDSGVLTFNKDSKMTNTTTIKVEAVEGLLILDVLVACPNETNITIVEVCVTNDYQAGQIIHNQYRFIDAPVFSYLTSNLVEFTSGTNNPLVSSFNSYQGVQGIGSVPTDGSTVTLISKKNAHDTFDFDPYKHHLRFLRSDTLYTNTSSSVKALITASTNLILSGAYGNYYGQFTMPSAGDYLYLIWDYRYSQEKTLCKSTVGADDACCNC